MDKNEIHRRTMNTLDVDERFCPGCGALVPRGYGPRKRKWCSDQCRRRTWDRNRARAEEVPARKIGETLPWEGDYDLQVLGVHE